MILVTGGTGLVGSHLLYHLTKENDNIIAIYRSEDKLEKVKEVFSFYNSNVIAQYEKIIWVKADITDITSLEAVFSRNIKLVYHCAALVSFNPQDYHKMRKVNIEGTANVVNFCIAYKITKLCYVSSIATLGETIKNECITEETARNEAVEESDYAITKYGAEMEVWRASQENVAVIIVNPGVILGSGFYSEGSGKIVTKVYHGLRFYISGVTGFVGVKDVVNIMILLTKTTIKNQRYILISENKSFKELFNIIAKTFHKKSPSIIVNAFVTNFLWRIDWFFCKIIRKKPFLTKHTAKASQNVSYYSAQKIKEELQYEFEPLKTTIKNICANFNP